MAFLVHNLIIAVQKNLEINTSLDMLLFFFFFLENKMTRVNEIMVIDETKFNSVKNISISLTF